MKQHILPVLAFLTVNAIFAQQKLPASGPGVIDGKTVVVTATEFHETQALNTMYSQEQIDKMKFEEGKEMDDRKHRKPQTFKFKSSDGAQYGNDPSTIQTTMGTREPVAVKTKWNGQNGNSDPLDPSGAPGMTQYVQSVNATPFAVYDKAGTGTPVFTGSVGTITGTGTDGDPVVLYDKFADRWLIAQLGAGNSFALAVSKTNNPAGAYSAYKFTASQMPDYLKFSVWENGYYMTSNNGSGIVYCFERAAMIAANPNARAIYKTFTEPGNAGFGFFLPLPGDADGVIPPSGLRCPLFAYTDNAWGTGQIDAVKVWSMGVTWGTTPAADITLDATIPTAAFDASYDQNWNDITQPGSQKLDGLGGVTMFRAQWNNFVGSNRVVLNWGVKLSSTQRSIKWVELRQDQTTLAWSLYQEGTYAPDAANRWIGSIAMDCNGDIALCYAKASSSISASLAYTGRLPGDPPGTMTIAETVVFAGTGSITSSNRFGDYSQTSIDPVDGSTFWHTGMYSKNGNASGIYSFQIAPCTIGVAETKVAEAEFNAYQSGTNVLINASKLPSDNQYVLEIFELSGKKVYDAKINQVSNAIETTIDVSRFAPGIYLIRIGTPNFQKVKKIVIQ